MTRGLRVAHALVAAARVVEERLRTAPLLRRALRDALAFAARRSREAKDYVRVRVRPVV